MDVVIINSSKLTKIFLLFFKSCFLMLIIDRIKPDFEIHNVVLYWNLLIKSSSTPHYVPDLFINYTISLYFLITGKLKFLNLYMQF